MRIVFSYDWYSEGLGYSENVLPALLAAKGHEVYVVTSTMQIYGDEAFYQDVYGRFLGPPTVPAGRKIVDGVHLIRLPISFWWRRLRIVRGRCRLIAGLKPDIVQTENPRSLATLALSIVERLSAFRLFTSEHSLASVYPAYYSYRSWPWHRRLHLWLSDYVFGWLACRRIARCYATTTDAAEIAVRFHGVPKKAVRLLPLGVDTRLFHPGIGDDDLKARSALRSKYGIGVQDVACIYTGRLTGAKNPQCLAQAIGILRRAGRPFRALFLGEGEQATVIAAIDGCQVEPFVPYFRLGDYYKAMDIGVWPCQESVSMLDAAAAGLPIVVSDRVKAVERVRGNGLIYRENDPEDLAERLTQLQDPAYRAELGKCGTGKMHGEFSAEKVAESILADYKEALL